MCQNWSSRIPTIFHEWYHFDQGTAVNDITDVTKKKIKARYGFRPFFKIAGRNENLIWTISPVLIYIES